MTFRRQIFMLVFGIFLIPIISISFMSGLFRISNTTEALLFDMRRDAGKIESWIRSQENNEFPDLIRPTIMIVHNNELLYTFDENYTVESARNVSKDHDIISSWHNVEGKEYQVVSFYEKNGWQIATGERMFAMVVPISIMLFIVTMSSWILRTLHKKIQELVSATEVLGQGNYSEPVKATGKGEFFVLADGLEKMRLRIRQDIENRSRLLMGISHDLKTPLAGIKGYLQAIEDGLADDKEKLDKYLSIISSKSALLEQRVSALIQFIKIETKDWQFNPSDSPVKPLTDNWFSEFQNDIDVSGRYSHVDNQFPNGLSAHFDVSLVRRALENLVSNAIKYSDIDSTIEISARVHKNQFEFQIENPGKAFLEQEQSKLFEAFYRVDNSRNEEGMGLGLTVVEKIASLHQGNVQYHYENAKHIFKLTLPFSANHQL